MSTAGAASSSALRSSDVMLPCYPTRQLRLNSHPVPFGHQTTPLPSEADVLEVCSGDVSGEDQRTLSQATGQGGRILPDAHETQEPIINALPLGTAVPMTDENLAASDWLRLEVRGLIREFLSVVPRSQPSVTLVFPRPDGTPRTLTRAELSAAIDWMRPRQKHIIRLAVEERRSQEEVCALLNGISLRTLQRDQAEALDLLAQL
jgi:hypothetical protein